MDKFDPVKLPQECVDEIIKFIGEHTDNIRKISKNPIIRDDIFPLLDKYCTVIYFPTPDKKNNGFHANFPFHGKDRHFVHINTSQHKEKQIFTAAHELGHIWGIEDKVLIPEGFDSERIVNRFAAELLMQQDIFTDIAGDEIQSTIINGQIIFMDLLSVITYLMNVFFTSYKSVVYRLYELDLLPEDICNVLWGDEMSKAKFEELQKSIAREKGYDRLFKTDKRCWIEGLKELLDKSKEQETMPEEWLKSIYERFGFDYSLQSEALDNPLLDIQSEEGSNNA